MCILSISTDCIGIAPSALTAFRQEISILKDIMFSINWYYVATIVIIATGSLSRGELRISSTQSQTTVIAALNLTDIAPAKTRGLVVSIDMIFLLGFLSPYLGRVGLLGDDMLHRSCWHWSLGAKQVPMERMDELFSGKWYMGWKAKIDLSDTTAEALNPAATEKSKTLSQVESVKRERSSIIWKS
jgi:hypothetical protein